MKNQTIVSMYPVFEEQKDTSKDREVKHYSVIIGEKNADGEHGLGERYEVKQFGEVTNEQLEGFLKGIRGSKIVGMMPNRLLFTRYVSLPAATPENLERMVQFEAQQNIPFPLEETVWGYNLMPEKREDGVRQVRMIALKEDLVERYFPFKLDMLTDSVDGVAKLYQKRANKSGKTVEILHYGEKATDVIILSEGSSQFSRVIPIGAFPPKKEGVCEEQYTKDKRNQMVRLYAEIARSNIFAKTQMNLHPEDVWTTSKTFESEFNGLNMDIKVKYQSPSEELNAAPCFDKLFNIEEIAPVYQLAGLVSWPNGTSMLPIPRNYSEAMRKYTGDKISDLGMWITGVGISVERYGRNVSKKN